MIPVGKGWICMRNSRSLLAGTVLFSVAVALAYYAYAVYAERRIPSDTPSDVRKQIVALRSADPAKRGQAARDLGYMKSKAERAIPFLVDLLADDNTFSDAELQPFSCVAVAPRDTSPGEQAAYALANIGTRAIGPLTEALESRNAATRRNAVTALRHLNETIDKPDVAAKELVPLLQHDPSPDVRAEAARALESVSKPDILPVLLTARKDDDPRVRERVVVAIGFRRHPRIAPTLLESLRDPSPGVRRAAMKGLEGLHRWGKGLLAEKTPPSVRTSEDLDAWKKLDYKQIAEAFITCLSDPSGEVRSSAMSACHGLDDPRLIDIYIRLLKDPEYYIRWGAAQYLGEKKVARSVDPLIPLLSDEDEHVRRATADALGKLHDRKAVEPLIAALQDIDWGVSTQAAESLGALRDRRAVGPLTDCLEKGVALRKAGDLPITLGKGDVVEPDTSAARALHKITGRTYGSDVAKWRAWLAKPKQQNRR